MGLMTKSDTNWAEHSVRPQKMARLLKFWIKIVEGFYYLCNENKGVLFFHMHKAGFLMMRHIYYMLDLHYFVSDEKTV